MTVRQLLDRAAKSLGSADSSIAGEPGVEGAVRSSIGNAYLGLGLYSDAEEQLRRAYILLVRSDAPMEDIIFARNRTLWARAQTGRLVILGELDTAFKMAEIYLGREHPETVYAANSLAWLYKESPKSLPLSRENLEIQRRRYGAEHELTLRTASNLVDALRWGQTDAELAEAESLAGETALAWAKHYGPEFPDTLYAVDEWGVILAERGKTEEARSRLAPIPDIMARVLGPDHYQRAVALRDYGQTLEATGDLEGALAQYRQALALFSNGVGGRFDRVRFENALHTCLARIELTRGRDNAAVMTLIPILERHAKTTPLPVAAERFAAALTDALADRGDPKTAIALLSALRNDSSYIHSRSRLDWMRPLYQSLIGGNQLRLGDRQQAIPMLRESVERMERSHIKVPATVLAAARARLARVDAPGDTQGHPVPSGR